MENKKQRTEQVAKNMLSSFFGQALTMLLAFVSRTVFIYVLSADYLGISGLFTSVLTVLSLSELGIGSAIMYALYKPVAQGDQDTVASLMAFYKKAYRAIGVIVLCAGLAMLPFLDYLIKGSTALVNVRIVFLFYLMDSVSSYWLLAYKQTLLEADQQKYVITIAGSVSSIAALVIRIGLLLFFRSTPAIAFYCYSSFSIVEKLLRNIIVSRAVNKRYPYLRAGKAKKLTPEQREPLFKNVVGVFISKFSAIMINAADNILISAFISIGTVGIYSNYLDLRSYVIKPINIVFDSITASIGNYCATEPLEKQERFFKTIQFTYFWIYGFCSISLWTLLNPFIGGIWIGRSYLMSDTAVFLIVLNFLLDGLAGAVIKFRTANGLFWQAKFRYFFSALFNAVISYLLIRPLGVEGVLLGTTASILIMISFDPIIVFKHVFKKSPLRYYLSYLGFLGLVLATGLAVHFLARPFGEYTVVNFLIKMLICAIVPNGLWYLIFRNNWRMTELKAYAAAVLKKIRRR